MENTKSSFRHTRRYCLFNDNVTDISFSRVYHRTKVTLVISFVFVKGLGGIYAGFCCWGKFIHWGKECRDVIVGET